MCKKIFMLSIFGLFLIICQQHVCAAEPPAQFGYVNVANAVLLHPLMKEFDAKPRRFKLSALKDDQGQLRNQNMEKLKKELSDAQSEYKKLEDERIATEKDYTVALQKLSNKKFPGTPSGDLSLEKYNQERTQIDIEFTRKLKSTREDLKKVQNRIAQMNQESEYVSHASHEETHKVFGLILDDVYEAVDAVAKFYKIPFVFNSSFEFARTTNQMTLSNPMPEFFSSLDQRLSEDPEGQLTVAAGITSWLEMKNNNLVNCSDARLTSFVLKGGVNMTPAVVDYIFQKHEISKSHRDFMQDYFKKVKTDK